MPLLSKARHIVIAFIDFFHKPFARIIPVQTFRYLACGGSNTVLSILIYSIAFNFVLGGTKTHIIDDVYVTAPIGAQIISFAITFPTGFLLSRYIVFPESTLRGRKQFFRHILANATFFLLTSVLIKLSAILLPRVRPDITYPFILVIITILSYLSQRFYTFKTEQDTDIVGE